jgi:hypothetical protein
LARKDKSLFDSEIVESGARDRGCGRGYGCFGMSRGEMGKGWGTWLTLSA